MEQSIKQLKLACEEIFNTSITEEELFDISDRLSRLSKIAYTQMIRAKQNSTSVVESSKIKTLTQSQ